jgi:hypothetical protein
VVVGEVAAVVRAVAGWLTGVVGAVVPVVAVVVELGAVAVGVDTPVPVRTTGVSITVEPVVGMATVESVVVVVRVPCVVGPVAGGSG